MLRFLGFVFAAGFIVFLGVMAAGAYIVWDVSRDLPEYSQLAGYEPPVMTRVHAGDGSLIAEFARERRLFVPTNAMPERLIEAFISAEDKTFFEHSGLDIWGIVRAAATNVQNMMGGGDHRLVGASTITQQVAKNFLLSSEQTLMRKLKEALLAVRIERAFSKEKILELYLNEIYLGFGSYGVAAAALNYFGKSLNELDLAEAAYLAALPKAPNNYHPFKYPDRAVGRRNWVIERMAENGYVTEEEAKAAMAEPLEVTPRPVGAELFSAEFFAEEVRREVLDIYGEKKLYDGGLSIRTTLDPKLQIFARQAITRGLIKFDRDRGWRGPVDRMSTDGDWSAALAKVDVAADLAPWRLAVVLEVSEDAAEIGLRPRTTRGGRDEEAAPERGRIPLSLMSWAREATGSGLGPEVDAASDVLSPGDVVYVAPARDKGEWHLVQVPEIQGALVAMDPHTGRVLALVGGFSYGMSQFDRAVQADRQPGSAFKPFVYAAALDNGYTPASVVLDAPISFEMENGETWAPRNYTRKFYGPSTLRRGVELSRNVMTVRLAKDMGIKTVAEYAERFGIYDNLSPVLAMALGAGETSLLRLTAAYAMLDNGGKRIEPTLIDRIQDRYGHTIYRHDKRECTGCEAQSWQGQPELVDVREQVINPYTAYQITSMLEGVVQRGTGRIVSKTVAKPLAGKTGTTNDYKDAWFVGFAPDLAVGVYVGYDSPRSMGRSSTGGQVAAPIFADFMKMALKGKPAIPFRVPSGIQLIPINPKNGQRAAYGGENVILEAFKPGSGPAQDTVVIGAGQSYGLDNAAAPGLGGPVIEGGLGTGTGGLY